MRDAYEIEAAVLVDPEEGRVDRRAGEERVAGLGEGAAGEGEGRDHAAEVDEFPGSAAGAVALCRYSRRASIRPSWGLG